MIRRGTTTAAKATHVAFERAHDGGKPAEIPVEQPRKFDP